MKKHGPIYRTIPVPGSKWRELLYPGEWSVWFVLVGLLASLSDKPVFIFMYYICAVAALVAMGFLLLGIARHIIRRTSHVPAISDKDTEMEESQPAFYFFNECKDMGNIFPDMLCCLTLGSIPE